MINNHIQMKIILIQLSIIKTLLELDWSKLFALKNLPKLLKKSTKIFETKLKKESFKM